MAYTQIKYLDGFDTGNGGNIVGRPRYWPQDVLNLAQMDDTTELTVVNIIFKGEEISGMVGKPDAGNDPEAVVLLQCPPYVREGEFQS